jgi:hypothetical protein
MAQVKEQETSQDQVEENQPCNLEKEEDRAALQKKAPLGEEQKKEKAGKDQKQIGIPKPKGEPDRMGAG